MKIIEEGDKIIFPSNLNQFVKRRLNIWIENAYVAKFQLEEGNHYSILDLGRKRGQAVINDLQTGVEQINTQWSEGLQQFIQLKHTNKLNEESLKAIFMSNYIYFKLYGGKIYGMTGTLGERLELELLSKAYNLDFFQLPRFMKDRNVRLEDELTETRSEWLGKIKREVAQLLTGGYEKQIDKDIEEKVKNDIERLQAELDEKNK